MIPKILSTNFQTVLKAARNGDLALMKVTDKKTGEPAYLVVIHQRVPDDPDGQTEHFLPVARVFEYTDTDNPYELYTPPTEENN